MTDEQAATTNSASPKAVREARKRSAFTERKRTDAWRAVLGSHDGLRVVDEIISFCGLGKQGFLPGEQAQYRDGHQNVAAFVIARCEKAQPNALELLRVQRTKDKNA